MLLSACLHGDNASSQPETQDAAAGNPLEGWNPYAQRASAAEEELEDPESSYVLNPRDSVTVTVYRHTDLSTAQRIDGNGRIRMSLIGTVEIAGKSIREAEDHIRERYRDERILRNAEVAITVEDYAPRYAAVMGNVESPGRILFPIEENRVDIVDIISQAGGFTRIARADRVRLTRVNADGEENTLTVNVQEMMQGTDREDRSRVYVYPGDTIFVPERLF